MILILSGELSRITTSREGDLRSDEERDRDYLFGVAFRTCPRPGHVERVKDELLAKFASMRKAGVIPS